MRGKKGFTLIELLIVVIIVGILASILIPITRGNILRARATEGVSGLGSILTQMRLIWTEHGAYNGGTPAVAPGAVVGNVPGFQAGDLDGRFFDDVNYTIVTIAPTTFSAQAQGTLNGGTSNADMSHVLITIDQTGNIVETYT